MFWKSSLAFALTFCLLLPTAFAQQPQTPTQQTPPDDEDDVVRITTNLVQMDAIVTDKQGRHVTDLRAEDFEIEEDGRKRDITEFSYISTAPAGSNLAAAPPVKDAKKTPPSATVAPVARVRALSPEQTRRTIVLTVDDLGMSFDSFPFVKRALRKYIDEQMQSDDLVAVVRTSSGSGAIQQLTSDKRQLYAIVEQLRWRPSGRARALVFNNPGEEGRSASDAQMGGSGSPGDVPDAPPTIAEITGTAEGVGLGSGQSALGRVEAARQEARTIDTLSALNFIVNGLRRMPGRKSVILFSDGLSIFSGDNQSRINPRGMSGQLVDSLRRLTDAASRASVIFYAIHSTGQVPLGVQASDDGLYIGGNNRTGNLRQVMAGNDPRVAERRALHAEGKDGLVVLSRETGGFAVLGNNDMGQALGRVINDHQGFYLIGYRPDEKTFDPETGRRKYRDLTIRVKRPGLSVRTRSGFYGVPDAERPTAPTTRDGQLLVALASPFTSGGVGLRLTAFFGNEAPEGSFVRSMLHIDTRSLTFKETPDGWREAVIDVLAAVFQADGTYTEQINQTHTVRVKSEAFERSQRSGLVHTLSVPVKNAGAYQLRVAVRDAASERVGSANQFVEVPEFKDDRLALSGLVAAGAPAPAAASSSPGAPSVRDASAGGAQPSAAAETEVQASPAVRRFRTGMRLDFGYVIYNAKLDSATGKPRVTTQISLFRDGKRVFLGEPETLDVGRQTDLKRLVASGRLRLGADLTPGEYILQTVVTDTLASEKSRTVSQWLDFEIVR